MSIPTAVDSVFYRDWLRSGADRDQTVTKFKLLRNLDVRMYGISPPLWAFLGAGDETRTRDSLLGRRSALCAVASGSFFAYSCGFLLLLSERFLSSYGVVNERLPAGMVGSCRPLSCSRRRGAVGAA